MFLNMLGILLPEGEKNLAEEILNTAGICLKYNVKETAMLL